MLQAVFALIARDLRLAYAQGGGAGLVVAFYALAVTLFPLGVGPEAEILAAIGPGVLWIAALLAALLSLDRLFQADFEDGTLEGLALGPLPLPVMALAKALAHWLAMLAPLVLLAPLFGVSMQLSGAPLWTLTASLAAGTPALSLIGAAAAALTVAVRRGGALIALLVLPLYIPPLVFGVATVEASRSLASVSANFSMLIACTMFAAVVGPLAAGGALKLSLE